MWSKFSSQSKILSAAVPVKGVGWISVEGFVVSCVNSWFINCTGSISIGSSGNEMSKELSLESVREVSNDCDSWSRSVRWYWTASTRESAINSCFKLGTLWQLDDSISPLYRPRLCYSRVKVRQIRALKGLHQTMMWRLSAWSHSLISLCLCLCVLYLDLALYSSTQIYSLVKAKLQIK